MNGPIAVVEAKAVAFLDSRTGAVQQVPASAANGRAVAFGGGIFVASFTKLLRVTPGGVQWTADLPHVSQTLPAALDDGGVVVQSEDEICAAAA
jgi:hypothetical protein